MGSLTSKPKAPKTIAQAPLIVTVPASSPAPVSYSYTSAPVSSPPSIAETPSDADIRTEARSAGLLERRRGVLSTVLTGFRGILSDTAAGGAQRKSLLGE